MVGQTERNWLLCNTGKTVGGSGLQAAFTCKAASTKGLRWDGLVKLL